MRSLSSLKNKLGFISLVLALSFAMPCAQAKPVVESSVDLMLLSVRKLTPDLVYIEMIQQIKPQPKSDKKKAKLSLKTSRKEANELKLKKLNLAQTDPQE